MAYSASETAAIVAASPLTYERALELASELGKTHRSVIAKAKQMGVDYVPKAKPAKRPKGVTKADLVSAISARLGVGLDGLETAKMQTLETLLDAISQ